jgi:hypothetical protein
MLRMAPDDYYDRIERWSSSARYTREGLPGERLFIVAERNEPGDAQTLLK